MIDFRLVLDKYRNAQETEVFYGEAILFYTFAAGKSHATSSCGTPPGPEGSKGTRL